MAGKDKNGEKNEQCRHVNHAEVLKVATQAEGGAYEQQDYDRSEPDHPEVCG
jgi:hypothetical protein